MVLGGQWKQETRKKAHSAFAPPKALLELGTPPLTHLTSLVTNKQSSDNSKSRENKWNDLIKDHLIRGPQHHSKGLSSELPLSPNSIFHAL